MKAPESIFNILTGNCHSPEFKFSAHVINMGKGLKDVVFIRDTWKVSLSTFLPGQSPLTILNACDLRFSAARPGSLSGARRGGRDQNNLESFFKLGSNNIKLTIVNLVCTKNSNFKWFNLIHI